MPPFETMDLDDPAVLWPYIGRDSTNELVVGDPEDVDIRIQYGRRIMTTTDGRQVAVDARAVVDREVELDSLLWEGRVADLFGTGSSGPTPGSIMIVVAYNEGLAFKGHPDEVRREVGLSFYKGRLPPVVPTDI